MKLFWKLFCSMVLVAVLGCAAGGSLLIDTQLRSSLQREAETLGQENDLLCYALSVRFPAGALPGREELAALAADMELYSGGRPGGFRLCDASGAALGGGDLPVEAGPLIAELREGRRGWELRRAEGRYYLHAASPLPLPGETVYMENCREVSGLFALRDRQYRTFTAVTAGLGAAAAAVSLLVSALILRPLRRLSAAAGRLAAGDLAERVAVRGEDEIAGLSGDFNAMADRLERQVDELRDEARRREDFIGSFTHELKTPLTSIIGYAELLRARPEDREQVLESAGYIFREGRRLEALSRKLLELIVLDRREPERRPVPMAAYLNKVGGALRPALRAEGLRLFVEAAPGTALIDPDLVEAVCLNLIDNARKAGKPGGSVWLSGFPTERGYCVEVADDGRGIPPEDLGRVTEPFYMADKSRSRAQGGAGLGLALCRRIAKLHGGDLFIRSEPGRGTAVRVYLEGVSGT